MKTLVKPPYAIISDPIPVREARPGEMDAVVWNEFGIPQSLNLPKRLRNLENVPVQFLSAKQVNTIIKQFKTQCKYCGENFPPALDFHHRDRREKLFTISQFRTAKSRRTLSELLEEINKCDVLCATCHRKIEYGGFREASLG